MKMLRNCLKQIIYLTILLMAVRPASAGSEKEEVSDKDILVALFENLDVKLSDAAYCTGAGTDYDDVTIGDYLSGFWVYHTNETGQNRLDISYSIISHDTYLAKVMIYRKHGEENWGWGVSFEINEAFKVTRNSFTCLGAG